MRLGAASWLASLRAEAAREPLRAALAKEKKDLVRAAMMEALEALGEPLESLMDRDGLVARAAAAKDCPVLAWPELAETPALHWSDTGKTLEPAVVRAFLSDAHKAKTPAPPPLLRLYARAIAKGEREAYAALLLGAWIAHDSERLPAFDATTYQSVPGTSAIEHEGVLAVAAAFGGPALAEITGAYLREHYGNRAAQCKALLQMLAWVDDPRAIQLLLATGARFRTAGIRAEAESLTKELAERRGWTLGELADRTIPDAGLDEKSQATIDYGARRFTATLEPSLRLVLRDQDGAVVKALPDARKDEDEARVKAAKLEWSKQKKQIETVLRPQRDRLYEAMCTGRAWRFEDRDLCLARHPIVRQLVPSVVFTSGARSFRPLGDGTLTMAGHDAIALAPDAEVKVAHALTRRSSPARRRASRSASPATPCPRRARSSP